MAKMFWAMPSEKHGSSETELVSAKGFQTTAVCTAVQPPNFPDEPAFLCWVRDVLLRKARENHREQFEQ